MTTPTVSIEPLDNGRRYAFVINGRVQWAGSLDECKRRAALATEETSSREDQDAALGRACR